VELLDLRTIVPWDQQAVLQSVRKTGRCLVVHEDIGTAGFGAEVLAFLAQEAFMWLDAPLRRITAPDSLVPYSKALMAHVVPNQARIKAEIEALLAF
jgi:2-oxoisovalerate dehydrogenase E1 component